MIPQIAEKADSYPQRPEGESLVGRYRRIRGASEYLAAPLSPEDCMVQSMPDASPAKWHLAHTSWFFETLILERGIADYAPFRPEFRVLYNSYYNTLGKQHPRPQRGMVTRPGLDEVLEYRRHVDERMLELLERGGLSEEFLQILEVGLNHEQQHQELLLTDIKHLFSRNPLKPAYRQLPVPLPRPQSPSKWLEYSGGLQWIGWNGEGFAYDNEGPRHRVFVAPFRLASRLATNDEFLAFMEEGGYRTPALWLSDGWATLCAEGWEAPFYWEKGEGEWRELTLGGLRKVRPESPVCHLSFYEADAFARWAGARLPSEAEWEVAAESVAVQGNFVDEGNLHPIPTQSADSGGPQQLFGDVWEWTRSSYSEYPGYRPPAGPLGEYNSKFMCNQLILRGGSCATPSDHIRHTYRNFFPPQARWQFSGVRLAQDLD